MRLLRRHSVWLLVATLMGIAGALFATSGQKAQYTSAAQVDVEARVFANTVPVTPNLATEEQVARSGLVTASAAPKLGMTTSALISHLSVSVLASTNILTIGCTMPTAAAAQNCAAAAAAAYIGFRNDVATTASVRAHDPLGATLVTPAPLPGGTTGTSESIMLVIGAIVGLTLGLGAVFVRDRADDRVRDRDDLEQCLDAPALVAIPRVRRRSAPPASVFSKAPNSAAAEAYRYLRVHLDPVLADDSSNGKVVLVAGPRGREGRTCVAANLAAALAHAGAKVVLVDADLRHPSLGTLFGIGIRPGFTDLLSGGAPLGDVVAPTGVPRLQLVTVGTPTDRPADMFEVTALHNALARMTATADVVIVDSAPVLTVSDPLALAFASDVIVTVANVRRTTRTDLRAAAAEIRTAVPKPVVGVLNCVPRSLRGNAARPDLAAGAGAPPLAPPAPEGTQCEFTPEDSAPFSLQEDFSQPAQQ
jgi:capsular exopolysaccharide synthesis family protein